MQNEDEYLISNFETEDGEIISKDAINFLLENLEDYEDDFVVTTVEEYQSLLESHMNLLAHLETVSE